MLIVQAVISDQVHTGHFKVLQMLVQLWDCATMFSASNITMQLFSLWPTEFQFIQVSHNLANIPDTLVICEKMFAVEWKFQ